MQKLKREIRRSQARFIISVFFVRTKISKRMENKKPGRYIEPVSYTHLSKEEFYNTFLLWLFYELFSGDILCLSTILIDEQVNDYFLLLICQ